MTKVDSINDFKNYLRHNILVFKGHRGREVFHNIEPEYIPQYVSRMRAKGYNLIQKIPMSDIG